MLLTISLLAPFLGPLALVCLRRTLRVAMAVDGFVLVAIAGLVCLHALPESFSLLGWPALVAAIVGLFVPKVLHAPHAAAGCQQAQRFNWVGLLAAAALLLHALADGVGLVQPEDHELLAGLHPELGHPHVHVHAWLPYAVALHRLVEGMGLWWLLRSQPRAWLRWGALASLGCATALGFVVGAWAQERGFAPWVALLQASVAGSLGHVLLWHAPAVPTAEAPKAVQAPGGPEAAAPLALDSSAGTGQAHPAASALGGGAAALLLWALSASEAASEAPGTGAGEQAGAWLMAPMAQQLGWLGLVTLAALGVAVAVHAWRGGGSTEALPMQPRWRQALAGSLAGLGQTACSCGVLPLLAGLRRRGADGSYVRAFVAAAPALGLMAVALSCVVLGPRLTLLRILGVLALALGAGLTAPRRLPGRGAGAPGEQTALSTLSAENPLAHDAAVAARLALQGGCGPVCADDRHAFRGPSATLAVRLRARLRDGLGFAGGEVLDFTAPWLLAGVALALVTQHLLAEQAVAAMQRSHLEVLILTLVGAPLYLCAAASTLVAVALLGKGASCGAVLAFLWSSSSLSPALFVAFRREGHRAGGRRYAWVMLGGACVGGLAVNGLLGPYLPLLASTGLGSVGAPTLAPVAAAVGCALCAVLLGRAVLRQGVRGAASQLAVSNRMGLPSHHHHHH